MLFILSIKLSYCQQNSIAYKNYMNKVGVSTILGYNGLGQTINEIQQRDRYEKFEFQYSDKIKYSLNDSVIKTYYINNQGICGDMEIITLNYNEYTNISVNLNRLYPSGSSEGRWIGDNCIITFQVNEDGKSVFWIKSSIYESVLYESPHPHPISTASNLSYSAKAYYMIVYKDGQEVANKPLGNKVEIDWDSFFKNYKISFYDEKGVQQRFDLSFIKKYEDGTLLMTDSYKNFFTVRDSLNTIGVLNVQHSDNSDNSIGVSRFMGATLK